MSVKIVGRLREEQRRQTEKKEKKIEWKKRLLGKACAETGNALVKGQGK